MNLGEEWRLEAACFGADPNLFFAPDGETDVAQRRRESRAKAICAGCPVRTLCLVDAIAHDDEYGIRGGTTAEERGRVLRSSA